MNKLIEYRKIVREIQTGKTENLTMSLRKIRWEFKKNKKKIPCYNYQYSSIPKECNCINCGKIFFSKHYRKLCSSHCRRIRHNSYMKNYYKKEMSDWQFALKMRLRWRLKEALNYYSKTGKTRKTREYLDYKSIIKKLGPCPGKRNEWHLDHIKPLSSFDFSNINEINAAFAPKNLQWLPAKENLSKGKF